MASSAAADTGATDETADPTRVLVVEDDRSTQLLFDTLLSKQFEVDVEGDPRAGLVRAERVSYDLVLLDIYLQHDDLDGVAVLRDLRSRTAYARTPIVAITAYALPGDRERFIEAGFTEYVSKPFERSRLLEIIQGLIGDE